MELSFIWFLDFVGSGHFSEFVRWGQVSSKLSFHRQEFSPRDYLLRNRALVIGSLLGISSFILYVSKLSPTVYSGDSGDLILAAVKLGVPHPPGYPLYTLIGHLFSLLPFGPSPAWKINLSSAFFEAATVTVVFFIIYHLTKKIMVAFFGASLLAFSFTFWYYALFAEVFALSNFLASLTLLFLILLEKKRKLTFFYLFALVFGLALAHHHTTVLLIPAFVPFLYSARVIILKNRAFLFGLLFLLLGLSFYLYLPLAGFFKPPVLWGEPNDPISIFRTITRADYGTFQATRYYGEAFLGRFTYFLLYGRFFFLDFTVVGIFLLFLGFIYLFLKSKVKGLFFLLAFSLSGFLFLAYTNFPLSGTFEIGVIERFVLLSFVIAVVVMSFGLHYFSQLSADTLKIFFPIKKTEKLLKNAITLSFLILPATLLLVNLSKADLSKNYLGQNLAEDILITPEENSLVLLRGDTVFFNSQYFHLIEGRRPDLKIIPPGLVSLDWYYYESLPRLYPELSIPQEEDKLKRIQRFIEENNKKFPVYYFEPQVTVEGYIWIPLGLLHKLYPKEYVPSVALVKDQNDRLWAKYHPPIDIAQYRDLLFDFSRELYAGRRFRYGNYFLEKELYEDASNEYEKALTINPEFDQARLNLGRSLSFLGKCHESLSYFTAVLEKRQNDFRILDNISFLYQECFGDEEKSKEFAEKARIAREKTLKIPSLEKF